MTALTWIALALSACGGAETEPPEESVVAEANVPGLGAPEAQPPAEEKQSETPPSSEGGFSLSGVSHIRIRHMSRSTAINHIFRKMI